MENVKEKIQLHFIVALFCFTCSFNYQSILGLYNFLVKKYVQSIPDFQFEDEDDYLLYLIHTYLNISFDLKCFDAIYNIENLLFDKTKPLDHFLKKNNHIYFKIVVGNEVNTFSI